MVTASGAATRRDSSRPPGGPSARRADPVRVPRGRARREADDSVPDWMRNPDGSINTDAAERAARGEARAEATAERDAAATAPRPGPGGRRPSPSGAGGGRRPRRARSPRPRRGGTSYTPARYSGGRGGLSVTGGRVSTDTAGLILAVFVWSWVVLPVLRGGPGEMRNVLRAKFTNKGPGGEWLP